MKYIFTETALRWLDFVYKGLVIFIAVWMLVSFIRVQVSHSHMLDNQSKFLNYMGSVETNLTLIKSNQTVIFKNQAIINSNVQKQLDER